MEEASQGSALPRFGLPIPDPDVFAAKAAERHALAVAEVSEPGRFIGVSLGAWIDRVQRAGVECVPADMVFEVERDVWRRFEEPTDDDRETWQLFHEVQGRCPATHMLRWDPCSGWALKHAMGKAGEAGPADRRTLDLDDPRAFDILYEFPDNRFAVWQRPWVRPLKVDGFPVEFRVFVRNSTVAGVASYYPQRPLPATQQTLALAGLSKVLATAIVASLHKHGEVPWMPGYEEKGFLPSKVSATMDFIVTEEGRVVFLEAGPPYGAGAHPCAFLGRDRIEGVALALADGVKLR